MPFASLHSALFAACLSCFSLVGACKSSVPSQSPVDKDLSAREIVERYKPAIVRIESMAAAQVGVGTGFILTAKGRIATNLHVIAGAESIVVKLSDGSSHPVRRVVGFDMKRDLAIIEIDAPTDFPTVPTGDSDKVAPGDAVVAIGNPMSLDFTVSDGLISSVRPVAEDHMMLQISAPISQGSSGGPLFNLRGEVIGVAVMVSAKGQNLNFGVPVNYLRPLLASTTTESVAEFRKRFVRPAQSVVGSGPNAIPRDIPVHDVSLLASCSRKQVMKVYEGINRAIQLGAPLYNDGDHEACYGIYRQTAEHFEKDDSMCEGIRKSFGQGLLKASTGTDFTKKAWAMRDTFDGLLQVMIKQSQEE